MTIKAKTKKKLKRVIEKIEESLDLLVKCGGPGSGVPGPCPDGGSGGGGKPTKPSAGKEKPPGSSPKVGPKISDEAKTAPPPGKAYTPNVDAKGKDGITTHARVGVPAMDVPPPPPISRMPNLTKRERRVEASFIKTFEKDPDGMAKGFIDVVKKNTKIGEALQFGTDDAKVLAGAWSHADQNVRSQNRATLNTCLHQTANAVAKRSFIMHLDTLKPGDEITVTVGGCGSGKGYGLKNVPEAKEMKARSKAVWDSAGDQNATENPWVQKEAEKRGLKVNYVYVHVDPKVQWGDPGKGVVKRAGDPGDGRMVDAKVFADSYAIGAKNHQAFYEANKNNKNANFVFLGNSGDPKKIDGIPKEALSIDRKALAKFAREEIMKLKPPTHIERGALQGDRIWPED